MRAERRRSTVHLAARALVAGVVGVSLAVTPAAATTAVRQSVSAATTATSTGDITFVGHGWGHGRGMSQFGALGYAVDGGWSATQILTHYYGGTRVATDAGNPTISVELTRLTGRDTIVQGPAVTVNGTPIASGYGYALVRATGTGSLQVYTGPSCAGPWTAWSSPKASGLELASAGAGEGTDTLLRTCEAGISYGYRGVLRVVLANSTVYTLDVLPIDSYLRGVLPKEVSGSWGTLGGGRGRQALQAQAVAARSYALASSPRSSGASVCDTTACQVYGGAFSSTKDGPSASLTRLESTETDLAVSATAGVVMRFTSTGAIARTEFSSSSGGWTAGGTFPAVVDDGDDYAGNPNHDWSVTYTASEVAAKLGLSGVRSVTVTARNGLGDLGGRVTTVVVVDGSGTLHSYSGAAFRTAMGTSQFKSDWFAVSMLSTDEVEKVVAALYRDVLNRSVEPSGLEHWTQYVLASGDVAGLVREIATSRERMNALVTAQYRSALNRTPEPSGLDHWVAHLESGRGVYDLQIGIYGSPESLSTLGRGDVSTWVGALYRRILGRSSTSAERAYWVQKAAERGRESVVASIASSDEATLRRLTVYYRTFLLRGLDPSGTATFLPMMTGRGDFDVPVHLGSSPEYWARAQTR